jgi:hypothetical protein
MERHATLVRCVDVRTGEGRHLRLDRIDEAARGEAREPSAR